MMGGKVVDLAGKREEREWMVGGKVVDLAGEGTGETGRRAGLPTTNLARTLCCAAEAGDYSASPPVDQALSACSRQTASASCSRRRRPSTSR